MKGDDKVIESLNEVLTAELTAVNIYFIHYRMQENWGYEKLAEHARHESMGEMKHADQVIVRTLFLDGTPNMGRYDEVLVGDNVEDQLNNEYKIEMAHVERLRGAIQLCLDKRDFVTKELLDGILTDTEDSVDWLETQFQRIKDVGIQNYLTEHMKTEG
ncbi:MAG: bacterioferritin [Nitrospinaceae bacterium]